MTMEIQKTPVPSANDLSRLKSEFVVNGYVVLRLFDEIELLDEVIFDMKRMMITGNFRTNSKIYSYNQSPRIVEAWRKSRAIHQLALNTTVLSTLLFLFGRKPQPFSTINFFRSTQQPLHSDYVHFGTVPHLLLAAAWIALEDIDPRSGPLQLVPGSHKEDFFCYSHIGHKPARSLTDVKEMYTRYEEFIATKVTDRRNANCPVTPHLAKGDVIIWDANLLHGSPNCDNSELSRLSQVTHYHFAGVEIFYNPSFSLPYEKKFVKRNVQFIPEEFRSGDREEH